MPDSHFHALDLIDQQKENMVGLLIDWARINSFSDNVQGLSLMHTALNTAFASLGGNHEKISLSPRIEISASGELLPIPQGDILRIVKRPEAKHRILLAGHMDTVYDIDHPFHDVELLPNGKLRGPGVADMKGGLVVMLKALEAFEKHPSAKTLGWEVLITPDEEVGSMGSNPLFIAAAKQCHAGLVFEPAFADGAIVSSRKGSWNLALVARGKSAHAGRDFSKGRNAIVAIANAIVKIYALIDQEKGITVNPGYISGGGPVNIVPDLAICSLNIRTVDTSDFTHLQHAVEQIVRECNRDGIRIDLHTISSRKPKRFDPSSLDLFEQINACAQQEGYTLALRPSGGVCDGNIMAEYGLPVIDTMGVIGTDIHTPNEAMEIDSLVTRSRLTARYLITLASSLTT